MNIKSQKNIKKMKSIYVIMIVILICTNISFYDGSTYIDYNRTLTDAPFTFDNMYFTGGEGDSCTSEMLGKNMGELVNNALCKHISQNREFRQLFNIDYVSIVSKNSGGLFWCDEIVTADVQLFHREVADYIHKMDGKKRAAL